MDADLKAVKVDLLVNSLILASITIKLTEFIDLAPNTPLVKKFMVGQVECQLSAMTQHSSVTSMWDQQGNRVDDGIGQLESARPDSPSRSVAATPRSGRGTPGGRPGETKEQR